MALNQILSAQKLLSSSAIGHNSGGVQHEQKKSAVRPVQIVHICRPRLIQQQQERRLSAAYSQTRDYVLPSSRPTRGLP